ncbi:MAG: nucleoside hydrolase [Bacteroidota bacterium]
MTSKAITSGLCTLLALVLFTGCGPSKMQVIFDTDANNELDDQHALAYLLFNDDTFETLGVTVNATFNGGDIDGHFDEAQRVMRLCDKKSIPLIKGANANFEAIRAQLGQSTYDGSEAVDFIISSAKRGKVILLAVGKLTNVALAVEKDPSIIPNIRLVWLGANYPSPGEYNLVNDIPSMNYLLDTDIHFEMVTVRYGEPSGTDAVKVTPEDIASRLAGKGPQIDPPVEKNGTTFNQFGDYAVSLFEEIELYGDPPGRALFDMAAVAIVKNPNWATSKWIPSPTMQLGAWVNRPDNARQMLIWENFQKEAILEDFYQSF